MKYLLVNGENLSKPISLLRFQIKVLSGYFRIPKWNAAIRKEFIQYTFYYFMNFWYYLFLSTFEDLFIIRNKKLKAIDQNLADIYNENNQFWVSLKEVYRQKSEKMKNLTYGETSYFAIKSSLEFIKMTKDDVFYDLGCGVGKTVFYANTVYGAKSIGIEIVPDFVTNGSLVIKEQKLENISFIEKSIFDVDLKKGTVFYITPTCFDDENMIKVIKKFETLPKGSRVIVLSKHLTNSNLKMLGKKTLFYSWGMAETFYYLVE